MINQNIKKIDIITLSSLFLTISVLMEHGMKFAIQCEDNSSVETSCDGEDEFLRGILLVK